VVCAVDINPSKADSFLAGARQQIIHPERLPEFNPDIVLVMNPLNREEVGADMAQLGLTTKLYAVDVETCAGLDLGLC
jgi:hypothetical protein